MESFWKEELWWFNFCGYIDVFWFFGLVIRERSIKRKNEVI